MKLRQQVAPIHFDRVRVFILFTICLCLGLGFGGCDEDEQSPSTLEERQILAIQVTPRSLSPGQSHTLSVLGHELDDDTLTWQTCLLPWIPELEGIQCAAEEFGGLIALGSGNPLMVDVPDMFVEPSGCVSNTDCDEQGVCDEGVCRLTMTWWVKVTDERENGALDTVRSISTGPAVDNPSIDALEGETPGQPLADTVVAGAELAVTPLFSDPLGEGDLLVSYFTTGGVFDPWRTFDGASSTLTAPDDVGELTLTVIIRDSGGGVGWFQTNIMVVEAP
jgi:hypothetical protein